MDITNDVYALYDDTHIVLYYWSRTSLPSSIEYISKGVFTIEKLENRLALFSINGSNM